MSHQLSLKLGDKADLDWAQDIAEERHYLHQRVHPRARPMVYIVELDGQRLGLVIGALPHATRSGGWWGYPGLPTQWQVVDLCRIWLDPAIQIGGYLAQAGTVPGFLDRKDEFRPTVASWVIAQILQRIQADRVSLWPPVILSDPYHIRLVISYHDPQYHNGAIYRYSKAEPLYTDEAGQPSPGSSGKYCWGWRLPEPGWSWQDIEIRRPRTIRMF